jgi:hypothetical protein
MAESPEPGNTTAASARNRLRGIVSRVQKERRDGTGRDAGRTVPGRLADEPGGGRRARPVTDKGTATTFVKNRLEIAVPKGNLA